MKGSSPRSRNSSVSALRKQMRASPVWRAASWRSGWNSNPLARPSVISRPCHTAPGSSAQCRGKLWDRAVECARCRGRQNKAAETVCLCRQRISYGSTSDSFQSPDEVRRSHVPDSSSSRARHARPATRELPPAADDDLAGVDPVVRRACVSSAADTAGRSRGP
jgi:hypothetical protein